MSRHNRPVGLVEILADVRYFGMIQAVLIHRSLPVVSSPNDINSCHAGTAGKAAKSRK
jgi:hypothetical protein